MTPVANANRAALFASMVRADTGFLDFFIPPAEKKHKENYKVRDKIKFLHRKNCFLPSSI